MGDVDKETWATRAAMCELLALSLRYPGKELADVIDSGEWVSAAREIAAALDMVLPDSFGGSLPDSDVRSSDAVEESGDFNETSGLLEALRPEATYLFVGAPRPACPPYEGAWRAEADGVRPLMFVNPRSMEVERYCHACGLGHPDGTNEPLDHVATEFELLEILALRAAGAVEQAEGEGWAVPDAELPGGSASAAYDQFVADHLSTWVPDFAERLFTEARIPFYRSVAGLLSAFLAAKS